MPSIDDIKRIAEIEFADIVKSLYLIDSKLRIILINDSFIDIYLSQKLPDKFGFQPFLITFTRALRITLKSLHSRRHYWKASGDLWYL